VSSSFVPFTPNVEFDQQHMLHVMLFGVCLFDLGRGGLASELLFV